MIALRLVALVVPVLLTLAVGRRLVLRVAYARPSQSLPSLDHTETALLKDTSDDAVLAGFAVLRCAGVIDSTESRSVFAVGPPPSGASAVDRAVHAVVARGASWYEARHDPGIRRAVAQAEKRLRHEGLIVRSVSRMRLGLIALATIVVAIAEFIVLLYLTAAPIWAGTALASLGLPSIIVIFYWLKSTSRASRAGRDVLWAAMRRFPLSETVAAGRWLGGPTSAGMAVATHGVAAIWTADPRFADQAGLPEVRRSDSGGNGNGGNGDDSGDGGDGD